MDSKQLRPKYNKILMVEIIHYLSTKKDIWTDSLEYCTEFDKKENIAIYFLNP